MKTHTSSSGRERPTYIMQHAQEVNLSALLISADSISDMKLFLLIPISGNTVISRDFCHREPNKEGVCPGWAPDSEGKWDRDIFLQDGDVFALWREREAAVRQPWLSAVTSAHLSH